MAQDPLGIAIRVQLEPFDAGAELNAFCAGSRAVGGVASFIGLVRDLNLASSVAELYLEHYPGMTERSLQAICEESFQRWPLHAATVIHRYGNLLPGEPIVAVFCAATHRGEAFAACEFIMDYLKTRAPFWKRERTPDGLRWVDARESDASAAQRWSEHG